MQYISLHTHAFTLSCSSLFSHALITYTCKHTPSAVLVVHVLGPLGTMRAAAQCRLCGAGVVNIVINPSLGISNGVFEIEPLDI